MVKSTPRSTKARSVTTGNSITTDPSGGALRNCDKSLSPVRLGLFSRRISWPKALLADFATARVS